MSAENQAISRRRAPWLIIAGGVAVIGAGVFVCLQSFASVDRVREFYAVEVQGLRVAGELAFQIQEGRRTVIYALTSDDPNQQLSYIDEARAAGDSVTTLENRLSASKLNGGTRRALGDFSQSWKAYLTIRDQIIAAILLGDGKKGLELDLKNAHPAFDRVKTDFTRLQTDLDRSAGERLGFVTATLYRTMIEVAILLCGMLYFLKTVAANNERRRVVETLKGINSELESAQMNLRDRELRLRTLFDNVTDGIISIDDRGMIQSANAATEKLFGYEAVDLIGNNIKMLMPQPAAQAHDDHLREHRETGVKKIIGIGREVKGQRKDGSKFPLELTVSEVMTDGRLTYVGILRDITERRRAEEALKEGRRQMMDITANIPGAVFQMQRSGESESKFLFFSEGIHDLSGRHALEIIENPHLMMECVDPDDAPVVERKFRIALSSGTPLNCTYRVHRNGSVRWLSASAAPQCQSSGETLWNGVITDVTASKEAEQKFAVYAEQLAEAAARAEAATKAKSEFLATMSHEIRTPMNGVIGMTGLLLETPLTAEQKDHAETIRASGEALLGIINDILDFSKIEAGKLDLEYCAFDIRPLVEDSLEVVAPMAQRKKTELCAPMDDAVPPALIGDPARLRQILLNLLSNAIKFTEAGEVVVSVLCEKTPVQGSVLLRFEIRDTGIGISPEVQARLFNSFTQADSSTTRRFGGTGLGLAISKKLVELMGGEIGLRSAVGTGSTFWFTIPFKTTTESIIVPAAIENLIGRRVLAVDDNGTNRSVLKQQLSSVGMIATCAASGPEALEELVLAARHGRPYELAILDLHMPVMNGLMLAKEIRALKPICEIPLMMLTSDRDREEAATARELKIRINLVKPVRQANLIRAVGDMFGVISDSKRIAGKSDQPQLQARILVAEDNLTNQKVIVLRLQKLGCTVQVVLNGIEAVRAVETTSFDAILMDCQMPIMDGFEATSEIRKKSGRHIPIIALTANAMDGERERCLAAGMDDYLSKPIRVDELLNKLQFWVRSAGRVAAPTPSLRGTDTTGIREALEQFVKNFEEEGIERDQVNLLFESFLETSPALVTDLREAVGDKDSRRLANAAHTLKGNFADFGLKSLVNLAAKLEKQGNAQLWDGVKDNIEIVLSEYQQARQLVIEAIGIPVS